MKTPQKGDIFWLSLDPEPTQNVERARPCLIVSNNTANRYSDHVMVCPISTDTSEIFPFECPVTVRSRKCKALLDQARPVEKLRLTLFIASIPEPEMSGVNRALKVVFDLE